jgi:hypothetical protein
VFECRDDFILNNVHDVDWHLLFKENLSELCESVVGQRVGVQAVDVVREVLTVRFVVEVCVR